MPAADPPGEEATAKRQQRWTIEEHHLASMTELV
jgi:hypothetical protein